MPEKLHQVELPPRRLPPKNPPPLIKGRFKVRVGGNLPGAIFQRTIFHVPEIALRATTKIENKESKSVIVQEPMEIFSVHLVQILWLKIWSPCLKWIKFYFLAWLPLGPITVLGLKIGTDFELNPPHKMHTYNLVIWYTMVIQAIKHYSWQRYEGPTLNLLIPKLSQKEL